MASGPPGLSVWGGKWFKVLMMIKGYEFDGSAMRLDREREIGNSNFESTEKRGYPLSLRWIASSSPCGVGLRSNCQLKL
jgi:hypothetical protein